MHLGEAGAVIRCVWLLAGLRLRARADAPVLGALSGRFRRRFPIVFPPPPPSNQVARWRAVRPRGGRRGLLRLVEDLDQLSSACSSTPSRSWGTICPPSSETCSATSRSRIAMPRSPPGCSWLVRLGLERDQFRRGEVVVPPVPLVQVCAGSSSSTTATCRSSSTSSKTAWTRAVRPWRNMSWASVPELLGDSRTLLPRATRTPSTTTASVPGDTERSAPGSHHGAAGRGSGGGSDTAPSETRCSRTHRAVQGERHLLRHQVDPILDRLGPRVRGPRLALLLVGQGQVRRLRISSISVRRTGHRGFPARPGGGRTG